MAKFLKLRCKKCSNEQVSFSHSTHEIKCSKCEAVLLYPMGGKARLGNVEIVEEHE